MDKKVSAGKRGKQKAFLELFPQKKYHIGKTCDEIGISRASFVLWRKEDPWFEEQLQDCYERRKDDYENDLRVQSESGFATSTIFFLKTKCKDRGYGDEDNINITDNEIKITIVKKDNAQS